MSQRAVLLLSSLALLHVMAPVGCRAPSLREARRRGAEETIGFSVEARPIRAVLFGTGKRTSLLVGVVHGNEPLGEILLETFVEHLRSRPELFETQCVIIVPVLNPDGLERGTRTNARGVDLNRNFPARNWRRGPRFGRRPGSEPETRALLKIIRQFQPERILAVHSPLRMMNYDGPARELAERMASTCDYPVTTTVGYPTPGSLGSYTGVDWQTPTITLELGRDVTAEDVWERFHRSLEIFLTHR